MQPTTQFRHDSRVNDENTFVSTSASMRNSSPNTAMANTSLSNTLLTHTSQANSKESLSFSSSTSITPTRDFSSTNGSVANPSNFISTSNISGLTNSSSNSTIPSINVPTTSKSMSASELLCITKPRKESTAKGVITVTPTSSFITKGGPRVNVTPNFHNPLNNLFSKNTKPKTSIPTVDHAQSMTSFNKLLEMSQKSNNDSILESDTSIPTDSKSANTNPVKTGVQQEEPSLIGNNHTQNLHIPKSPGDDLLISLATPFTPLSPIAESYTSKPLAPGQHNSLGIQKERSDIMSSSKEDGNLFSSLSGRREQLTQRNNAIDKTNLPLSTSNPEQGNENVNFENIPNSDTSQIASNAKGKLYRLSTFEFENEDASHPIYNSQGVQFKYSKYYIVELPILQSYYPYNNRLTLENFCKKRQITLNDPTIVDASHCYIMIRFKSEEFQIQQDNGNWVKLKELYKISEEDKSLWLTRSHELLEENGIKITVKKGNRIYLPAVQDIERFEDISHPFYKFILTKFARKYNIDLSKPIRVRYRDGLIQILNRRNHWVTRSMINHIDYVTRMKYLTSDAGFKEELKRKGNHLYIILPQDSIANQKTPIQLNLNSFSKRHDIDIEKEYIRLRIKNYNIIEVQSREGQWKLFYDFERGNQELSNEAYGECLVTTPQKKGSLLAPKRPPAVPQASVPRYIDPQLIEATNQIALNIIHQLFNTRAPYFPSMPHIPMYAYPQSGGTPVGHTPTMTPSMTPTMTPVPGMMPTGIQNIPVTPSGLVLPSESPSGIAPTPIGMSNYPLHGQIYHHDDQYHQQDYDMGTFGNDFEQGEWVWDEGNVQFPTGPPQPAKRKFNEAQQRPNNSKRTREDEDLFEFPMEMDIP